MICKRNSKQHEPKGALNIITLLASQQQSQAPQEGKPQEHSKSWKKAETAKVPMARHLAEPNGVALKMPRWETVQLMWNTRCDSLQDWVGDGHTQRQTEGGSCPEVRQKIVAAWAGVETGDGGQHTSFHCVGCKLENILWLAWSRGLRKMEWSAWDNWREGTVSQSLVENPRGEQIEIGRRSIHFWSYTAHPVDTPTSLLNTHVWIGRRDLLQKSGTPNHVGDTWTPGITGVIQDSCTWSHPATTQHTSPDRPFSHICTPLPSPIPPLGKPSTSTMGKVVNSWKRC